MLPLKPIRLALSIAVRTLFIAPAAALLALSVIERACSMCLTHQHQTATAMPVLQETKCNANIAPSNGRVTRIPRTCTFWATSRHNLHNSLPQRYRSKTSLPEKHRGKCILIPIAYPWILPTGRLRHLPAVPIRVLEGWRCNSVVESPSLIALLCGDIP